MTALQKKLDPRRFPGASGKMKAIIAHVLGMDPVTDPAIEEMVLTSDGMVLARNEGDYGFNNFIGHVSDYRSNWERLIEAAGLTPKERSKVRVAYAMALKAVGDNPDYGSDDPDALSGLSGSAPDWTEVDWDENGKAQGWLWQTGPHSVYLWHYKQRKGGMDFLWRWRVDFRGVDGAPHTSIGSGWAAKKPWAVSAAKAVITKHRQGGGLSGVPSEPRGAVLGYTIPSPAFNEVFLKGYIRAALWSSNDESREDGGDPLDQNYSAKDLAKETLAKMTADCEAFIRANADDLWAVAGEYRAMAARNGEEDWWPSWMGHDFWLTRNGHGAGFFDRDLGEVGDRLTKASDRFPEVNLYVHRKRIYQG